MTRLALILAAVRIHRRDLRWYWLGAQIPLLVLAMAFAPKIEAKVAPSVGCSVSTALEHSVGPLIASICKQAPGACTSVGNSIPAPRPTRAAPTAPALCSWHPKAKRHA